MLLHDILYHIVAMQREYVKKKSVRMLHMFVRCESLWIIYLFVRYSIMLKCSDESKERC